MKEKMKQISCAMDSTKIERVVDLLGILFGYELLKCIYLFFPSKTRNDRLQ